MTDTAINNTIITDDPCERLARKAELLPADKRIWLNGFAEGLLRGEAAATVRKQQGVTRKTGK